MYLIGGIVGFGPSELKVKRMWESYLYEHKRGHVILSEYLVPPVPQFPKPFAFHAFQIPPKGFYLYSSAIQYYQDVEFGKTRTSTGDFLIWSERTL